MRVRFAVILSIVALLISSYATRVFAHGEAADELHHSDIAQFGAFQRSHERLVVPHANYPTELLKYCHKPW